ncbi:helix-turn-helix transcriptional regulator [Pseudoalteromonas sp. GABNS16G]|uniref:helix-turn-helix domain-containing protein n=1 Tax=Pseudoalteromonas sp. GABNS16G TaxID=3025324 RepID=UPI002359A79F|nr:helix-turn-helix transcriptional regulator [Pseudoalteromonas sp. GABNS16G]MDC9603162.1 helix-turn-helix transcriptional regulator [Pseudoalteromonas sp. GABNS16G]
MTHNQLDQDIDNYGAANRGANSTSPFGARLDFAMSYARKNGRMLREQLDKDHGITLTRSTLSKLLRGRIKSSKHTMEIAEVLGVNPKWLQTGRETMTDITGRLSSKERGMNDVKRIARQYLIPQNRADIVRLHDKLITAAAKNQLSHHDVSLLDHVLSRALIDDDEVYSLIKPARVR